MKKLLIIALALGTGVLPGQSSPNNIFDFKEAKGFKVVQNGDSLVNAWAGGLNNVSLGTMDLNLDGIEDLVIYEKSSRRVTTFITDNSGSTPQYRYAPEYQKHFPVASSWIIIEDYDCDNKKDVFYNMGSKVHVLRNTSNGSFSLNDPIGGPIEVQISSGLTSLYASEGDKPALADIDEDDDLDFFSFSSSGSVAQFNENQANCGLDFILQETCWGHFSESGIYRSVNLDACIPYKKNTMHAGSSMLLIDLNDDGLKDLLLGNVSFPDVTVLHNTGSQDSTHFTSQDTLFPQYDKPISVTDFAALSYADVTHDGIPDLVASPFSEGSGFEDINSVHLYKNLGTATNPLFNFTQEDFMQEGMIDMGTGAVPRLIDLNSDAKPDLVISNYEEYDSNGTGRHYYRYYKNTGSFGAPEFTLEDSNFVNIPSYGIGKGSIPTFGDLDQDGDKDMIIGDENGQLHLFMNSDLLNPTYTLQTAGLGGIDVGQMAAPFLFDMDDDGDLDLLVGNNAGVIHYYENSSATSPSFSLKNDFFGAVNTYTNFSSSGRSIPYAFKKDSTINVFVGSSGGGVFQYDSVTSIVQKPDELQATMGTGNLVSTDFEETPFGISKKNGRNQFLIRADELKAMGFSYGYITNIAFDITTNSNTTIWQGVSIRCKLTEDSVLNDFQTGLTEVRNASLAGSVGFGKGWNELDFQRRDFLWDGESNLVIDICFGGQSSGSNIHVSMSDVGYDAHAIGNLVDNSLNHSLGCIQPYKRSIHKRPNIKITMTPALANTNSFLQGVESTAPALADLNMDGFPDMMVGTKAGGVNYFEGKVYDIGLAEEIANRAGRRIDVYPNPGNGNFNVVIHDHGQASLSVFDLTGKLILQREVTEEKSVINISNQPPGIYLFILSNGQELTTRKVMLK